MDRWEKEGKETSTLNGDRYSGEWRADLKHGYGEYEFADGDKYKGFWESDKIKGEGTYEFANGSKMQRKFLDGKLNGERVHLISQMATNIRGHLKNGKDRVMVFLF